jgi:hypothetical protein
MRSPIFQQHYQMGHNGAPDGGTTWGQGFCISWQKGPLGPVGANRVPNGAFVEDIIQAAIGRLEFYQLSPFQCDENAEALKHLRAAAAALDSRTKRRVADGTEGTHEGK